MFAFWLLCALLLLAALVMLLPPLLQTRTQGNPQTRRSARRVAAAVVLLLPLGTLGLYLHLGQPRALDPAAYKAPARGLPVQQAIDELQQRLQNEPDNLEGWLLLARAQRSLEQFQAARDALAQAHSLAPDNIDIQIQYAELQVLAAPNRRFEGAPLQLLQDALKRQPTHPRGLWLLGISHYQHDEFEAADQVWSRLLDSLAADDPVRAEMQRNIEMLRAQARPAPPQTTAADGPRLQIRITLDPALSERVQPHDRLFVYARAAEGPRMPLAARHLRAADLPAEITLDDDDAMLAQMKLSDQRRIIVGARISRSGEAQARSGDLEVTSNVLELPHPELIELNIDRIVP